jgi:hypothetical protein
LLKIHTCDGKTTKLDLQDEDKAEYWLKLFRQRKFQETITGITVVQECCGRFKCPECNRSAKLYCSNCDTQVNGSSCKMGIQNSLSKPVGFDEVFYIVEKTEADFSRKIKGNKKVICVADNCEIVMTVHDNQPASRVTLTKQKGVRRFNPYEAL